MKNILLILFAILWQPQLLQAAQPLDSLFRLLDKEVEQKNRYVQKKNNRIELIKEQKLDHRLTPDDLYQVNERLYNEYKSFNYDSAKHYVRLNLEYARNAKQSSRINDCLLNQAHILMISGLYQEAQSTIEQIDTSILDGRQRIYYYNNLENLYLYKMEYVGDEYYHQKYLTKIRLYRDTLLTLTRPNSYEYVIIKAPQLIDQGHTKASIQLLTGFLPQLDMGTREYSIVSSIAAFAYGETGDVVNQKKYLLLSAISDIRASNKETNSMRVLAEILWNEEDTERSYSYLKESIEEANYFHARLRNLQALPFLPAITARYELENKDHHNKLLFGLVLISLIALFVIILLIYSYMITKRLRHARSEVVLKNNELEQINTDLQTANTLQQSTNEKLAESNTIKEEYIGRFLNLCSNYIDSNNDYRKKLYKLAANHKIEELYGQLKTSLHTDDQLSDFYHNFDSAFLKIFPQFVTCFNQLLPLEEQIKSNKPGSLSTELRIFALIRLGITDSQQIAGILHSSITTIYTYRSKMKNKSLKKESFEKEVMKIN